MVPIHVGSLPCGVHVVVFNEQCPPPALVTGSQPSEAMAGLCCTSPLPWYQDDGVSEARRTRGGGYGPTSRIVCSLPQPEVVYDGGGGGGVYGGVVVVVVVCMVVVVVVMVVVVETAKSQFEKRVLLVVLCVVSQGGGGDIHPGPNHSPEELQQHEVAGNSRSGLNTRVQQKYQEVRESGVCLSGFCSSIRQSAGGFVLYIE